MKKILYTVLAVVIFTGCSQEDGSDNNGPRDSEVQFSAGVVTRAYDASWEYDDRVGIFALDGGRFLKDYNNVQYKIDDVSQGRMKVADAGEIFYPSDCNSLDFYAYYPYVSNAAKITNVSYTVDVTDQSTVEKVKASDLMWAVAENQSTPCVPLSFSHQLVKLTFRLEANGVDITDLTGMTAILRGANAIADFDLRTGIFNKKVVSDITLQVMVDAVDNTKATVTVFVVPTTDLTNVQLVLNAANGKKFIWKPETTSWDGGKSYSYTLTTGLIYQEYGSVSVVKGYFFNLLPPDKSVYKLYILAGTVNRYKIENLYGGGQDVEFSITNAQVSFSVPEYSYYNASEIAGYPLHRIPTAMDHPSYGIMTAWLDSDPQHVYCEDMGENDKLISGSEIIIATWYTVAAGYFGWYDGGDADVLQVTTIQ